MGTPALWLAFNAGVLALLALDLGIFHRRARTITLREAATWSAIWVALSLGFDFWIFRTQGAAPATQFLTGYLVEKSLSVDNIFIFLLVFRAFGIEARLQHRVLFWGVMGALVLRGILIGVGAELIARFAGILYFFGAFLVVAGVRMLFRKRRDFHPDRNPVLRWARRIFNVSEKPTGECFWIRENGRFFITPLLLTLLVLEGADLVFALDSIPAVFGITHDPFLVYTSNVCAILGMRSFYFLIAGALPFFRYLDAGLSAVLIFIGGKMLAEPWIHLPTYVSLLVVGALLGTALAASLIGGRRRETTNG